MMRTCAGAGIGERHRLRRRTLSDANGAGMTVSAAVESPRSKGVTMPSY